MNLRSKIMVTAKAIILSLFLVTLMPVTVVAQDNPDEDGFLNDRTIDVLRNFKDESGFRSFSNNNIDGSIDEKGLDNITGLVAYITGILKWTVGGLALLYLVITIFKTISASADGAEEELGKLKKHMIHAGMAFFIVFTIDFFVNNVFVIAGGQNFLGSTEEAKLFGRVASGELMGLYRLAQAIAGTVIVAALAVSGMKLVGNAGNDEALGKAKKHIGWAAAGLVLLALAEIFVQGFLFKDAGTTIDVETGKELIVKITNFASGFISMLAVVSLLYAGYLYVVSGVGEDNTDKVKKIVVGAVIAILVAGGAFAVVNTVVKLDSSRSPEIIQNQVDSLL